MQHLQSSLYVLLGHCGQEVTANGSNRVKMYEAEVQDMQDKLTNKCVQLQSVTGNRTGVPETLHDVIAPPLKSCMALLHSTHPSPQIIRLSNW